MNSSRIRSWQEERPCATARVVIIGGEPAGASCVITLKKIASSLSLKPGIIVYEGKLLARKSYYKAKASLPCPANTRLPTPAGGWNSITTCMRRSGNPASKLPEMSWT
ncbi:MAG: hypothetical protein QHH14_07185 [Clostridiales bacterium]|nr:hypothetical protein [Clostridiales bacterium]